MSILISMTTPMLVCTMSFKFLHNTPIHKLTFAPTSIRTLGLVSMSKFVGSAPPATSAPVPCPCIPM